MNVNDKRRRVWDVKLRPAVQQEEIRLLYDTFLLLKVCLLPVELCNFTDQQVTYERVTWPPSPLCPPTPRVIMGSVYSNVPS